jgi:two-component system, response regulator YesN
MLSIVIADDKPTARKGFETMIDWAAEGLAIVAVARDGREALEECRARQPDILLTDIKMPLLSGLDVARELRRQRSSPRVIFVSGYAEFQFARDAVEVRAEGYLLKPIRKEELLALIRSTVKSIRREQKQRHLLADLRSRYREYLPLLRVSVLKELFSTETRAAQPDQMREQIEALGLSLRPDVPTIAAVARIESYPAAAGGQPAEERRILELSVERMIRDELRDGHAEVFLSGQAEVSIIYQEANPLPIGLAARLERLLQECRDILGVDFSAGVGSPVAGIDLVRQSVREARLAVQHGQHVGRGSILCYESLQIPRDAAASASRPSLKAEIVNAVEVGNTSALDDLLGRFLSTFPLEGADTLLRTQAAATELLVLATQSLLSSAQEAEVASTIEALRMIFSTRSMTELRERVLGVLQSAGAHFAQQFDQQNTVIVERVKKYVREHFAEEISMQAIADAVFYSPNYVSLVFSTTTGRTIKEFVTDTRIARAKHLLRNGSMLVFEVASECGYDPHYFSAVFRKATGVSPRDYRDGVDAPPGDASMPAAQEEPNG